MSGVKMDQLVQCPVCTLFLHNGMTLESHLDTHPKDQVIKALCSIANKNSSCESSRTSTPANSERSYRSRSQTPAGEDSGRWNGAHRNSEHDHYWARTPSGSSRAPSGMSSRAPSRTPSRTTCRTPRSVSSTNVSRNCTPDIRLVDSLAYETTTISSSSQHSHSHQSSSNLSNPRSLKVDKMQQTQPPPPPVDFEQKYLFYPEQQEEREIKYSRSAEYSAMNTENVFPFNVPINRAPPAGVKLQPNFTPRVQKKRTEPVKFLPKSNILNLVKSNISGIPYLASGVKPMHVVVGSAAPTFVQKNVQNSMIMTGPLPNSQVHIDAKTVPPLVQNHFNQLSSSTYTPGTTVVTQNSQYFYQEMVQNIDPKTFIPTIPAVFTSENVTNVAQSSSMYQNVMLVDQFGNTSCMYSTPQQIIPKQRTPQIFPDASTLLTNAQKPALNLTDQKTLIFEVGPMIPSVPVSSCSNTANKVYSRPLRQVPATVSSFSLPKAEAPSITITEKVETLNEAPGTTKGLKILSNIKVEVPVQHSKNMINTVMDLTGSSDRDYSDCAETSEKNFPVLEEHRQTHSLDLTKPSTSRGLAASHSFAELKKISSPTSSKDLSRKTSSVDNRIDMEFGDSCPVPDLICNEKPSISPISELSESGENSTDPSSVSPKPQNKITSNDVDSKEMKTQLPMKPIKSTPLRLNNIFVKKSKKVLQIKNMKTIGESSTSEQDEPMPCSSTSSASVCFGNQVLKTETKQKSILTTISIEEIKEKDELAGFGHHSEDVKPQTLVKSINTPEVIVKEEISSSNEGTFSNESHHNELEVLDPMHPVNVVSYGNISTTDFEEESSNRELLDLEGAGKTKQFVNMINENYFGDNIYADYFTADRVEAFDEKEPTVFKENEKEAFSCSIWGEPSHKENDFVLPNFIHESYKIAESGVDYADGEREDRQETEGGEKDSKADVLSESRSEGEPPLNICADERMPPRGELSGQESNGDMDSSEWNGVYSEVTPAEPYDLIARESWVSDGSELDVTEKRDTLEEVPQFPKRRLYSCSQCGAKLPSVKELRAHKAAAHASPTCSYTRIVTATSIKKEEKVEDTGLSCAANILTLDTKGTITSTILQVYDTIEESKPQLDLRGLLKQETKRKRRDFVCATCKVDLVTEAAFNAHLRIHPLECLKCGKCFFRRNNLKLHLKTHLGIKNYKCDICEKRFMTRQKLSEHHNIHTGRAPVKCTLCDDTFRRYSNMVQHRNRHHYNKRAKVRDFVCHCGLVVHSRAKFAWHQETHEDRPKACVHCGDKFVHAASLTRHVRRKHNHLYLTVPTATRAENVPCPICKQIYLRTNLRAHLLTHSGKRPYSCVICNKAFTTKWNLKLHRWTHVSRSAKPFKCSLCKGAFIRRTEYISHMNSHKSVRPYTCNYCGCQFIRKYNCQRHVREHETAKKYVCKVPECGKSFHRSYYLSEHMKVHSGVRPFSCNICGKTSSNKSNHNKHVRIHHAREPVATEA